MKIEVVETLNNEIRFSVADKAASLFLTYDEDTDTLTLLSDNDNFNIPGIGSGGGGGGSFGWANLENQAHGKSIGKIDAPLSALFSNNLSGKLGSPSDKRDAYVGTLYADKIEGLDTSGQDNVLISNVAEINTNGTDTITKFDIKQNSDFNNLKAQSDQNVLDITKNTTDIATGVQNQILLSSRVSDLENSNGGGGNISSSVDAITVENNEITILDLDKDSKFESLTTQVSQNRLLAQSKISDVQSLSAGIIVSNSNRLTLDLTRDSNHNLLISQVQDVEGELQQLQTDVDAINFTSNIQEITVANNTIQDLDLSNYSGNIKGSTINCSRINTSDRVSGVVGHSSDRKNVFCNKVDAKEGVFQNAVSTAYRFDGVFGSSSSNGRKNVYGKDGNFTNTVKAHKVETVVTTSLKQQIANTAFDISSEDVIINVSLRALKGYTAGTEITKNNITFELVNDYDFNLEEDVTLQLKLKTDLQTAIDNVSSNFFQDVELDGSIIQSSSAIDINIGLDKIQNILANVLVRLNALEGI